MPAAIALTVHWSERDEPIYSAHFEPHGKGRLATAGGDNNVRIWKMQGEGDDRKPVYLSTLAKHNQAVNVVRWCPRGEMLASAGDDGNIILWVPAEHRQAPVFGDEDLPEDKETWRLKHMCRSMGSEIYDLAWSPDGVFFISGSMDNVARVWNAQTGQMVRQIAEHNHYVQGVAWDPLNEFVATQSSDRSVHIYTLKSKDGQFSLAQHGKISKMDLPPARRRISSSSPAPPEFPIRPTSSGNFPADSSAIAPSPATSTPGTPTSFSLPMNPPILAHSRRSSFSSSPSLRRSTSPAPALPLPAVSFSPKVGLGVKNTNIYYNETLTSFFRRLTFTPDGSLLLTPAGQFKVSNPTNGEGAKTADDIINTVYIYTRAGLNKPPIAHLPGHKKPSIAIKCSPVMYTLRRSPVSTKHITVDTSSEEEAIPALPPPAISTQMEPPAAVTPASQASTPGASSGSEKEKDKDNAILSNAAFSLPYRVVYAVATQDSVLIYDTQQQTPICVVSNLHYAAFTDLTWSFDGLTLLMTSTDGFCSVVLFSPGELGEKYTGSMSNITATTNSTAPLNPILTPTATKMYVAPPLSPTPSARHPGSPARSASALCVSSSRKNGPINNPTLTVGAVPAVSLPMSPQTPINPRATVLGKRDEAPTPPPGFDVKSSSSSSTDTKGIAVGGEKKRRRVAPTPVADPRFRN